MFLGKCWLYTPDSPGLHQIKRTHCTLLDAYPPTHTIEPQRMTYPYWPHAILRHHKPYLSNPVHLSEPFPLSICPMKAPSWLCQVLLSPSQFPLKLLTWFSASSLGTHTQALTAENVNTKITPTQWLLKDKLSESGYGGQLNEFLTQRVPCKSCFNHSLHFSAQIAHLSNGDINRTYFTEDFNELIHGKYW